MRRSAAYAVPRSWIPPCGGVPMWTNVAYEIPMDR